MLHRFARHLSNISEMLVSPVYIELPVGAPPSSVVSFLSSVIPRRAIPLSAFS